MPKIANKDIIIIGIIGQFPKNYDPCFWDQKIVFDDGVTSLD